jgi:multicomponent Na+:H+ antiporter subunit E
VSLPARVVMLVALWLLAWGEVSVGNVASGLFVAAALLVVFPPGRHARSRLRLRPLGAIRLVLYVIRQLVASNLLVAREILSRRSRVRTGVLAYQARHPSDEVLALKANVIALSPGTMTVEVTRDPAVMYVHFLLLDDVDEARQAIARLEDVVAGALGSTAARPGHPLRPRKESS